MTDDFNRERIAQATGDRSATSDQILWGFKVIKMIISADELHESEAAGLRATMQQFGASADMIGLIEAFDTKSVRLNQLLEVEAASHGLKRLIYAAVVVAWADGNYSAAERAAVAEVASYYKISPSTVSAIEHLVTAERELGSLRLGLLAD